MKVQFRNSTSSKVWVAVMYYSPDTCGNYGNWETEGWWGIDPGQQVWAFSTNNRYAAFYAEAEDGTTWSDGYGPMLVYIHAFEICLGLGQTGAIGSVGCRLIDTTGRDTVVNLIS
jgi:uncharacterized membrane protein